MKKIKLLVTAAIAALMFSCTGGGSGSAGSDSKGAVCIWDNVSLKETPEESGKWISSISIGEAATYLNKTKEVKTDKKVVTYVKIRLKDGKEGWAQNDFIILNSKPAAVVGNSEMYSRPDLLNKTGKLFSKMDIIAVKSEKDGFIEIAGKRKAGKWIETGWLKPNSVTYDQVDIAVAKYVNKAMEISDAKKRDEAIKDITNNEDLKASIFIPALTKTEKTQDTSEADTTEGED